MTLSPFRPRALALGLCALSLASLAACALTPASAPVMPAPAGAAVAAAVPQERREWVFAQDGVRFDNQLPGARLSEVRREGPRRYAVVVAPETHPINPSPWYGFRVDADVAGPLHIEFPYPADYRHRYHPKLGRGDGAWRLATSAEYRPGEAGRPASLQLAMDGEPLQVFAQPPVLPDDFSEWIDRIGSAVPIERSVIGRSVQGRPLHLFEFGGDAAAPLLVVIGRQHPPENTGSQALFGFVETLAGDTDSARAFRARVRTVVVPLVNPDGIVEGHWRTNLNRTDLNRDWGPFAEPETRAVAQALLARSEDQGRAVLFALDFHSTFQDIMYTVEEDPARAAHGVLGGWMAAVR